MNNTLYILEKKFQQAAGSVDEKSRPAILKKRQYEKLTAGTGISRVEYGYVLCDFFPAGAVPGRAEYIEAGAAGTSFARCRSYTAGPGVYLKSESGN